jgi:hypothetical protein
MANRPVMEMKSNGYGSKKRRMKPTPLKSANPFTRWMIALRIIIDNHGTTMAYYVKAVLKTWLT